MRVVLTLLLVGCGAAPAARGPAPAEPSPAVSARLASLGEPPVAWSAPVAGLSDDDFGRICPWLSANVELGGGAATCDDGRLVEPYTYECDPAHSGRSARSLPCSVTFGEIVACYLAMREHPCDAGGVGAGLAECEAFAACGVSVGEGG